MISAWPSNLPRALRSGHGYQDRDTRSITDMQQGPPRIRNLYRNNSRQYPLKFLFTLEQLKTFEGHYETTLAGGTKPTYIPVLDENGFRAVAVLILNKGAPSLLKGNYFSVTLTVVTYDQ